MAEESNELNRITDDGESPDAPATAVGATDTYQTASLGAYPAADAESSETDANATDETDETEQIRAEIEATRSQMSETIDAIQEKLSFNNIADQVKETVSDQISSAVETARDAVYDATIGKAGDFMQNVGKSFGKSLSDVTGNMGNALGDTSSSAIGTVRRNPIAFALIGAGVAMLFMQSRRRSSYATSYDYDNYDYELGADAGVNTDRSSRRGRSGRSTLNLASEKVGNVANTAYEGVTSAASSAYSGVSNAASSALGGVSSVAGSAVSGVKSGAGTAYQGLTSAASTAYDRAGEISTQARDTYEQYLEQSPLAVGAVAMALGAAVGMMIPSTRYEGELMGEAKEQLVQRAEGYAREAIDKVQQMAGEVTKTVNEQAKAQGMTQ